MRWMNLMIGLWLLAAAAVQAAEGRIVKVLPHYLDLQGRHALRPSLYERDAYQAELRKNPAKCSGLRFDIQWKGRMLKNPQLRIEARGYKDGQNTQVSGEGPAKKQFLDNWSSVTLGRDSFRKLGALVAWRATLWSEGVQVGEQRSFLW
jgi:hypothetical protein